MEYLCLTKGTDEDEAISKEGQTESSTSIKECSTMELQVIKVKASFT